MAYAPGAHDVRSRTPAERTPTSDRGASVAGVACCADAGACSSLREGLAWRVLAFALVVDVVVGACSAWWQQPTRQPLLLGVPGVHQSWRRHAPGVLLLRPRCLSVHAQQSMHDPQPPPACLRCLPAPALLSQPLATSRSRRRRGTQSRRPNWPRPCCSLPQRSNA